jgi:GNAT superfamily N-acetyltransferase
MTWTFRTALPSDSADSDRVLRAAFTPYMQRLGREAVPPGDYPRWLAATIERGDLFVADEAGCIVGVAWTERRDTGFYLERLAVDPAQQRRGLGSWLLVRLEEIARSRGDRTMSLTTAEMMDHLLRLYGRHGFEIVHRGPPDHGMDPHIRVTMVKPL